MNTLSIALNGFAPGASPLQIASQGLLITIEPAQEQDALWIPLRSYGPPNSQIYDSRTPKKKTKTRVDCSVEVTGCKATLSTYKGNVARYTIDRKVVIPKALEFLQTLREWRASIAEKNIPKNASRRKAAAKELLANRKKKRQLRDDANAFAASINPADLPDIARMLYHYILENRRLKKLLEEKTL
jgi:hypothetical protein